MLDNNTCIYLVIQANSPSEEALMRFNEEIRRIIERAIQDGRIATHDLIDSKTP
ncbi:hypothetical protein [Ferroacidibacillus organovorans]|uniref:hypothetical protein n=1 Tax=Ferroacidibacillus organovorans TaxID=1765683 RepID=UPI0012E8BBCB|nr:hypothetical protein [Ferroacidibacillus organovorans]